MSKLKAKKPAAAAGLHGSMAADRGSVAVRPWHTENNAYALTRIADSIVANAHVRQLLGVDVKVRVLVSGSGRGLLFEVEPL